MYLAFGGTSKGLGYKDLVCGLVLLTRGKQEEKVKCKGSFFIYTSSGKINSTKSSLCALPSYQLGLGLYGCQLIIVTRIVSCQKFINLDTSMAAATFLQPALEL